MHLCGEVIPGECLCQRPSWPAQTVVRLTGHDSLTVLFKIGPLHVYAYGMMLAAAVATSALIVTRDSKRLGIAPQHVLDFLVFLMFSILVGARLGYVVQNLSYYLAVPGEILNVQQGGLSFHGAVVLAIPVGIWFTRRRRIPTWGFADLVAPFGALGESITRVGCDIFGRPAPDWLPWAVTTGSPSVPVHPQQVYSIVLNYAIFVYLWSTRTRTRFRGELFLKYLALAGVSRFVIEFFRVSQKIGPLSLGQWVSLSIAGVAVALVVLLRKRSQAALLGAGASEPGGQGWEGRGTVAPGPPSSTGFTHSPDKSLRASDGPPVAVDRRELALLFLGYAVGLVSLVALFFLRVG
ncbi:MAG: prolipoprotein diacylglyceryl transferase [Firmicutes bacterium]|nr:prolipoprotein diacylglyceryl transferase [Bacillota bacterium]